MTFEEAMTTAEQTFVKRAGWLKKSVRVRYDARYHTSMGLWLEQWGKEEMLAGLEPQAPYVPDEEDMAATDWEISTQEPGG